MNGVPGSERFVKVEPIREGQSGDRKYRVETDAGEALLVRIGDAAEYVRKKAEYEMLERAFSAGVPTPRPLGFASARTKARTRSPTGARESMPRRFFPPRPPASGARWA